VSSNDGLCTPCSVLVDTDTNILNTRLKFFSEIRGVLSHLVGEGHWGCRGVHKGHGSPVFGSPVFASPCPPLWKPLGRMRSSSAAWLVSPATAGRAPAPSSPAHFGLCKQAMPGGCVCPLRLSFVFWLELPSEQGGDTGKADPVHDLCGGYGCLAQN